MARASAQGFRWRGPLVFLVLTFGLSWGLVLLFQRDWSGQQGPFTSELP